MIVQTKPYQPIFNDCWKFIDEMNLSNPYYKLGYQLNQDRKQFKTKVVTYIKVFYYATKINGIVPEKFKIEESNGLEVTM